MKRLTIAFNVWMVAALCVGVVTFVGFIIVLVGTGFHSPNPPLAYITLTVLPFLATATPTKLMSGYVARESKGACHAGPIVLGVAAGFVAAAALSFALGSTAVLVLTGIVGPIAGAILGTLVKLRMSAVAAGAVSAGLGLLLALMSVA